MTSETSEKIYSGVVAFRPGSLTPMIRVIEGQNTKIFSAMVEDYDKLRQMEGQDVKFKKIMNPYGPHIISDNGFAMILQNQE